MKFRGGALIFVIAVAIGVDGFSATLSTPTNLFVFQSISGASFQFGEIVGKRVAANIEQWLLRAPQANPGMLEMFRVRDRKPAPQIVPWAGEFVGKYLISAVQALRMSEDPRLHEQIARIVGEFIQTQADDGYLGPFPKSDRLLKNWDLWGHYHAIEALLLWHKHSGDTNAVSAARKAADLVCRTYLDTGRRVFDAGDHEMNMSILTAMVKLHRVTGEARYLRMAKEIERDWDRAGDYLRVGLEGREFFKSPRPRWESLHALQGLLELWRVTGDENYRRAFEHHWRSIRRWDRRNTGGFSSGEQATGNPYAPTAIETCCTVAWMALTIDYLKLTGDLRAADELEMATLNAGLGAQHSSGRWWTYSTPMDGVREASAHTIVFQARPGTPELNCCSVNGPRVLGMLSEWSVMSSGSEIVLNWIGAGRYSILMTNGARVVITSSADAWKTGATALRVAGDPSQPITLRIRIPSWAPGATLTLNGQALRKTTAGNYAVLNRRWLETDRLDLKMDLPLRFVVGANEARGKISLYRGPLLLAYDQAHNQFDEDALPAIDLARLPAAKNIEASEITQASNTNCWVMVEVPAVDGRAIRLVDFANAGSTGTRYRSWLMAERAPPAPAFTEHPLDGEKVALGQTRFQWRANDARAGTVYRLEFSTNETFTGTVTQWTNATTHRVSLDTRLLWPLTVPNDRRLWWRVVSIGEGGESLPDVPSALLILDPAAPAKPPLAELPLGPDGELIIHSLRTGSVIERGALEKEMFSARTDDGTELNGREQMIVYAIPEWPEVYTVQVRVKINVMPQGRIAQIFSAWAAGSDDPLRLVVENGKLFARMEAGAGFSSAGVPVNPGRWYAVAAVKSGDRLALYLDGARVGGCTVPEYPGTRSQNCALGGNPKFSGNEFLAASFVDFVLYGRALSPSEIQGKTQ